MKGQAELNALLLLTKRLQELKAIKIKPYNGYGKIDLEDVPESMLNYFTEKINDVVKAEVEKAAALVVQAALKYAEPPPELLKPIEDYIKKLISEE